MITGSEISWPITVVAKSRFSVAPMTCGAKPSSAKAATLSATVIPFSLAAISDEYTDLGNRRFARCWATATVSNQASAMTTAGFRCRAWPAV
ncbi:FMN-dependent alpha-hydroxy acid dehydrogenase domain protein [Mycobacterium kansasii 732]|nr:FMN-dependent alpha-hydroxy acid dehydrogenase domain protein [Mycobacterium kansasii 732]